MPKISDILYYAVHTTELRAIIQWKVWHTPVHERDPEKEPETLRQCFELLKQTSRSFSAVIQELHPELLVPIALFYIVLRGLDTIEDDMTIPLEKKEPLLRNFHSVVEKDGWTFTENGPNEKDRAVLVHFDVVVEEFKKLKPAYRAIIRDITQKMGNGMADYANNAEHNVNGVNTIKDYNLYCHYVAGLVGEGLTRLFVESKLASEALLKRPHLQESMGLFLQKTNIIRDIREDLDDKRRFWPKEIWSKYVDNFEDLCEKKNEEIALNCSSEMVLNALEHADECLFYLAGIREQSVFNFAAIPQTMAIATLELVFRNPLVFQKNVKITKGAACQLMTESSQNLQIVCGVFKRYAKKIHKKNTPKDPNFLKISIACAKIEQFVESIFPTQDPKTLTRLRAGEPATAEEKKAAELDAEAKKDTFYIVLATALTLGFVTFIMFFIGWMLGLPLGLVMADLKDGLRNITSSAFSELSTPANVSDHAEL
ncbi:MAG: Delta(24)-sterol C-methyltransferase [Sarea resinae]|nr:MAG: Delta(24)-sterol C-methyltransferase [Sarea resinae]